MPTSPRIAGTRTPVPDHDASSRADAGATATSAEPSSPRSPGRPASPRGRSTDPKLPPPVGNSSNDGPATLATLPEELLNRIAGRCDGRTVIKLAHTSKPLRTALADHAFASQLIHRSGTVSERGDALTYAEQLQAIIQQALTLPRDLKHRVLLAMPAEIAARPLTTFSNEQMPIAGMPDVFADLLSAIDTVSHPVRRHELLQSFADAFGHRNLKDYSAKVAAAAVAVAGPQARPSLAPVHDKLSTLFSNLLDENGARIAASRPDRSIERCYARMQVQLAHGLHAIGDEARCVQQWNAMFDDHRCGNGDQRLAFLAALTKTLAGVPDTDGPEAQPGIRAPSARALAFRRIEDALPPLDCKPAHTLFANLMHSLRLLKPSFRYEATRRLIDIPWQARRANPVEIDTLRLGLGMDVVSSAGLAAELETVPTLDPAQQLPRVTAIAKGLKVAPLDTQWLATFDTAMQYADKIAPSAAGEIVGALIDAVTMIKASQTDHRMPGIAPDFEHDPALDTTYAPRMARMSRLITMVEKMPFDQQTPLLVKLTKKADLRYIGMRNTPTEFTILPEGKANFTKVLAHLKKRSLGQQVEVLGSLPESLASRTDSRQFAILDMLDAFNRNLPEEEQARSILRRAGFYENALTDEGNCIRLYTSCLQSAQQLSMPLRDEVAATITEKLYPRVRAILQQGLTQMHPEGDDDIVDHFDDRKEGPDFTMSLVVRTMLLVLPASQRHECIGYMLANKHDRDNTLTPFTTLEALKHLDLVPPEARQSLLALLDAHPLWPGVAAGSGDAAHSARVAARRVQVQLVKHYAAQIRRTERVATMRTPELDLMRQMGLGPPPFAESLDRFGRQLHRTLSRYPEGWIEPIEDGTASDRDFDALFTTLNMLGVEHRQEIVATLLTAIDAREMETAETAKTAETAGTDGEFNARLATLEMRDVPRPEKIASPLQIGKEDDVPPTNTESAAVRLHAYREAWASEGASEWASAAPRG